jgi:hypothetical protein
MHDPLIPLCQIIAEKLREQPQADPAALVAYLREAMAAAPDVAAAIQTDARVVQINQGDATAFQTWVAGGVANIGMHLHDVDVTTLTIILERFLRERPSSTIPQNLPRSSIEDGPVGNGIKLASEFLLKQLLTQFLPGFDHKWETLGPPFLDARLYPMRSDGIDDQCA